MPREEWIDDAKDMFTAICYLSLYIAESYVHNILLKSLKIHFFSNAVNINWC